MSERCVQGGAEVPEILAPLLGSRGKAGHAREVVLDSVQADLLCELQYIKMRERWSVICTVSKGYGYANVSKLDLLEYRHTNVIHERIGFLLSGVFFVRIRLDPPSQHADHQYLSCATIHERNDPWVVYNDIHTGVDV